jgi:Family of unknown function (DUF5681)
MSPISDRPSAESKATEPTAESSRTGSEDKVGYKSPPKASRFIKGHSGNPNGRKKAKRVEDVGAVLDEILNESVQVREGEQTRTMTRLEATVQALRAKALKGDPKSMRSFLKLTETLGMFNKTHRKSSIKITEPDGDTGKMLRMYHAEQDALQKSKETS